MKSAVLKLPAIYLPDEFVELEGLPTNEVQGSHILKLWDDEMSKSETRLLHHLRQEDVRPDSFDTMNVGAAVRFFSPKTKSAIVTGVELGILPKEALTTAYFIMIIHEWFALMTSKVPKTSITTRNCDSKYIFLHTVIDFFQNTIFDKHWKPLNFAFILSTLSFCDAAEFLMKKDYDFVLGHRFTQDATENVFSQIRRKAGSLPSAKESLSAVKLISVSQYISDIKKSSYTNGTDEFLLDFCKTKKKR